MDPLSWAISVRPGSMLTRIQTVLTHTTDALSDQIVAILDANPLYARLLKENVYHRLKESKWKTLDETPSEKPALPTTLKTLHLLGLTGARDLLLDLRIKRVFGPDLQADPKTTLPFTFLTDGLIESHRIGYPHQALFAAALFDMSVYGLTKTKLAGTKVSANFINQLWKESSQAATLCYLLGAPLVGFELQKFCMSAPMLLGVGKLFSTQQPGWIDFQEKIKKKKKPYKVTDLYREQRAFPITFLEQTALIIELSPLFKEISPAILHYLEPYFLKGTMNLNLVKLCHLIRVSLQLTEVNGNLDSLSVSDWKDLQTIGLQKTTVTHIVTKWKRDFST